MLCPMFAILTGKQWQNTSETEYKYVIWKACKPSAHTILERHALWWWRRSNRLTSRTQPSATFILFSKNSHHISITYRTASAKGLKKYRKPTLKVSLT